MTTIAYDYIGRRQAQAHAEEIELDRVRADIAGMEAQVEKLTSNLAAARQYAEVLSTSIAMAQQLVEDQCQRNDWPLPEPVEPEPAPSPIERSARVSVDTGPPRTQAFKAMIACRHCGAPIHDLHDLTNAEPRWVHVHQDFVACDLVVPTAGSTHAEPAEPAATTRTDDPLRFQVLDQAEVREAVNGGE